MYKWEKGNYDYIMHNVERIVISTLKYARGLVSVEKQVASFSGEDP